MHGNFFTHKYGTFSQQIATASLQKVFTNIANQQGIPMLLAVGTCVLGFYITHAMIGGNSTNHSLEKKKAPCFDLLGGKRTFFPMFLV